MPNLSIHSYKQNEEGWDNVAVIVNDELLFRFPRKQEYAMRIPLEKELCAILNQSLQEIEVPQYHLIYKMNLMRFLLFVVTILSFMVNH